MKNKQFVLVDIHEHLSIKATILSIGKYLDDMKKYKERFKQLGINSIIIETTDWDNLVLEKCIHCTGYIYNVIKQLNLDNNEDIFIKPKFNKRLVMFDDKILLKQ